MSDDVPAWARAMRRAARIISDRNGGYYGFDGDRAFEFTMSQISTALEEAVEEELSDLTAPPPPSKQGS